MLSDTLNVQVVELMYLQHLTAMLHDNVQAVSRLFFVGVRHHAEGQSVMGMVVSVAAGAEKSRPHQRWFVQTMTWNNCIVQPINS